MNSFQLEILKETRTKIVYKNVSNGIKVIKVFLSSNLFFFKYKISRKEKGTFNDL